MAPTLLIVSSQARSVESGVGIYAEMVLRGLADQGLAQVTVATWGSEISADRYPGFRWIDLGARPRLDPSPGCFWTLGRRLVQRLRRDPRAFDLVHFLDAREGHAFVGSSVRGDSRVLGTVHDDYAAQVSWSPTCYAGKAADPGRRFLFHRWQKRLERSCYQKFDALMVNSEATGETLLREYAIDPERMSQVSLTVPPEPGEVAPEKLMGSPRLVFAGGNFYRKGLDVCLRALPELLLKFPTMMLHVVGTCRSEPSIRRLADRLDVAGSVRFHGQVEPRHVAGLLASADALVMPSRTEALGLVYLEAFRARVPVVAGNRGGVTEIVRDRRSGVVVSPDHPQMLAEGIDILLSNPELQRRVVQGGLEVLAERTPARLIEQTLAAYGLVREAGGADPADRRGLTTARS